MKCSTGRNSVRTAALAACSVMVIFLTACSSGQSGATGHSIYSQAVAKEQATDYTSAHNLYQQALPLLRLENDPALVQAARIAVKRTGVIVNDYSVTEEAVRRGLAGFSGMTPDTIDFLVSRTSSMEMQGTRYYFYDFLNTAENIDLSIMGQLPDVMARNRLGYAALKPFIDTPGPVVGSPYLDPVTYVATATYDVPRNELPRTGLLKIWQPVPINTEYQTDVTIISVTPASYVKNPASVNANLGDIYLEVPLDSLAGNLQIEVKFSFKRYLQRFTMIDPATVGAYDTTSALYREFTASGKNTLITPEITAKARQVVGNEQNPYLAARKIYDYVVQDLTYSHMPHASLGFLNSAESIFVHQQGYGDCGAQSMYFAALCRAIGIPARATGGYQLFPGMEGSHIWAEFYLPNYGWVPVDTSVAQIYRYLPELTVAQQQAFKDFFFGSMDPYRWTIQRDMDLPLSPPVPEPTSMSVVLQSPAVLCDEMDAVPEEVVWDHYQIKFDRM